MRAEMGQMREGLGQRERQIHDLQRQLNERDRQVGELTARLDSWKQRVAPLTARLKQQRDVIHHYREHCAMNRSVHERSPTTKRQSTIT